MKLNLFVVSLLIFGPVILAQPANDDFANAEVLTGGFPFDVSAVNTLATAEGGEPAHGGEAADHSIWYRFTASSTETHYFVADPGTLVGVYTGGAVNSLSSQTNPFTPGQFNATSGTTYYVALDLAAGATGNVGFALAPSPVNDDFIDRIVLTGSTVNTNGHNLGSSFESGERSHDGSTDHSVWYQWQAPSNLLYNIDTAGSAMNTLIAVYTSSVATVSALTGDKLVDENGDDGELVTSKVSISTENGTTYYIVVGSPDGLDTGAFLLNITPSIAPDNDHFDNARDIGALPVAESGSTEGATIEGDEAEEHVTGIEAANSVWFLWTSPTNGFVSIDTEDSDFDTILAVYTGDELENLIKVASNDNHDGEEYSRVELEVSVDEEYYIVVDGNEDFGPYNLNIKFLAPPAPANDQFGGAINLNGLMDTSSGNNESAGSEAGEPSHAGQTATNSVWWYWVAPSNAVVAVDTFGSDFDTVLAAYTGNAVTNLTGVVSNDDHNGTNEQSQVVLFASQGQGYYFAVDGANGETGDFVLNLRELLTELSGATLQGGGDFEITFPSETGVNYMLLHSSNLTQWTVVTNLTATTNLSSLVLPLPTTTDLNAYSASATNSP